MNMRNARRCKVCDSSDLALAHNNEDGYRVECDECGEVGEWGATEDEAVRKWNDWWQMDNVVLEQMQEHRRYKPEGNRSKRVFHSYRRYKRKGVKHGEDNQA